MSRAGRCAAVKKKNPNPLSISLDPFISDPKKIQKPDIKGSSEASVESSTSVKFAWSFTSCAVVRNGFVELVPCCDDSDDDITGIDDQHTISENGEWMDDEDDLGLDVLASVATNSTS